MCTKLGWQQLAYQDSLCELNVPRMNQEAFQSSTFGVLLQFNGDLQVNFSPNMNLTNMTTGNDVIIFYLTLIFSFTVIIQNTWES